MFECNTCHKPIDWDAKKREAKGTNRPLNPDGTIHMHTAADFEHTTTTDTTTTTPQQATPQQDDADKTRPPLVSLTQEETRILKDLAAYLQDLKKAKWSS